MTIKLIAIGKTDSAELRYLISTYVKRLDHYIGFDLEIIPDPKNTKNMTEAQQKEKEGEVILKKLKTTDVVLLLDENGRPYSSLEFADYVQKKMLSGVKQLVFVIGGPYGFSDAVCQKALGKISLSKMTFSHQMVRLFMVEQLYRAFSILNNGPYHHE